MTAGHETATQESSSGLARPAEMITVGDGLGNFVELVTEALLVRVSGLSMEELDERFIATGLLPVMQCGPHRLFPLRVVDALLSVLIEEAGPPCEGPFDELLRGGEEA